VPTWTDWNGRGHIVSRHRGEFVFDLLNTSVSHPHNMIYDKCFYYALNVKIFLSLFNVANTFLNFLLRRNFTSMPLLLVINYTPMNVTITLILTITIFLNPWMSAMVYIGWQWRSFATYLCQLVFAATLWVKLSEMFVTVISLKYALLASQWSCEHFHKPTDWILFK